MAPDTIVAAVAANTVWNMMNTSIGMLSPRSNVSGLRKPLPPMNPAMSLPNMIPKPTAKKAIEPIEKSIRFFMMIFFALVKPASTMAKPACMKKTRKAASSTHTVSRFACNWATAASSCAKTAVGIIKITIIINNK